jgi:hypothetical protein
MASSAPHRRASSARAALALIAVFTGAAVCEAACTAGSPACPIEVVMAPGTDTITLRGILTERRDCCAYALRARAGQVMTWRVAGPEVQTGMIYPNGQRMGPGLPASIRLAQNGVYLFGVVPDPMAEHAVGPFTLTFTIR